MSRLQFALGREDRVIVTLPSHKPGSASVRVGKAKVRVGSLSCAVDVTFDQKVLRAFFKSIRKCHRALAGRFVLRSLNDSFRLVGEIAPHGHVRVKVSCDRTIHRQRDDPQWKLEAAFSMPSDALLEALTAVREGRAD